MRRCLFYKHQAEKKKDRKLLIAKPRPKITGTQFYYYHVRITG